MKSFEFEIGQPVVIVASGERAEVIGRAEYRDSNPSYYLRYKAADGRATEAWWNGSALELFADQ